MIERFGMRAIVLAAIAVILVLAITFGVHSCDVRRSKAAQSRVERSQAAAASNSAADAVNAVAASGEAAAASEQLTRSNEKDIRNAQGSTAPVDPAARDAGLRALCLRRAYRDDPKCRVQRAHP
jgi:Flp pilus assembly protein TadB